MSKHSSMREKLKEFTIAERAVFRMRENLPYMHQDLFNAIINKIQEVQILLARSLLVDVQDTNAILTILQEAYGGNWTNRQRRDIDNIQCHMPWVAAFRAVGPSLFPVSGGASSSTDPWQPNHQEAPAPVNAEVSDRSTSSSEEEYT